MTVEETIQRIHARGRFSGKPGLHRIRALMDMLNNPQKKLKFIHLAGTNGKGSTATMIASILQASGYQVGLYTSPYLVRFHERIAMNGELISDADLIRLTEHTEQAIASLKLPTGEHIGEFEFVTAVAFQYFLEQQCDIVVLETGLGGEFDATNVIDAPEVAVLTSISFDHMDVLGNTLTQIARTKAGIIKPGSAVVSAYGQVEEVYTVLRTHAPDLIVPPQPEQKKTNVQGETFTLDGVCYQTVLHGAHQIQNASTAIYAVKALDSRGYKIAENAYQTGILLAKIGARMEVVQQAPTVLIDGGHNTDGVRTTVESLRKFCPKNKGQGIDLVIGMVADKAVEDCVKQFASIADRIIVTQPQNERALSAEKLTEIVRTYCPQVETYPNLTEALDTVLEGAHPDAVLAICGSLYLAGEAKQYFANRQKPTKS